MHSARRGAALLLAFSALSCADEELLPPRAGEYPGLEGDEPDPVLVAPDADTGSKDQSAPEGGSDHAPPDGVADAAVQDGEPDLDAGTTDPGAPDAAWGMDASRPDAAIGDATTPDAQLPDATLPDATLNGGGYGSFTRVWTILDGCNNSCHVPGAAFSLDLSTKANAYLELIGNANNGAAEWITCAKVGGVFRVIRGDPDNSMLVQKLENRHTCGDRMPPNGSLSAASIAEVRAWIANGALYD